MELLAPAGNWESLKSAVYNGADAVYLGLDMFNARMKADNFNKDNICDVTTFCHLHNVKVYVTVNVAVKQSELDIVAEYIKACNEASVDAFIISDIGIIDIIVKYAPSVPIHASTQMAIHNYEGAKIAYGLGFSRIVVARETLFSDIVKIKNNLDVEIEYFVHGALCVAFSGNCLFSSMLNGNSGNRGRCLQPCRLQYTNSLNGNTSYILSPSDQCLVDKLGDLEKAGVDSLKIEGRLKSTDYVTSVVRCYRKALDTGIVDKKLFDDMSGAFNRGGFTRGYNYDNSVKIMSTDIQGNIGLCIGKIKASHNKSIEFDSTYVVKPDMGIKIISCDGKELGGFKVTDVTRTKSGYIINSNNNYPKGSEVRITSHDGIGYDKQRLNVDLLIKEDGNILECSMLYNGINVKRSVPFEYALNKATSGEEIIAQLSKLNDTEFVINSLSIQYNDDLFVPKSVINSIRRELISELVSDILFDYNANKAVRVRESHCIDIVNPAMLKYDTVCEVENEYMISDYIANHCNIVINLAEICLENLQSIINKVLFYNNSAEILLKLPNVARGKDVDNILDIISRSQGLTGVYTDNLYGITIANNFNLKILGGILLNIYNVNIVKKLSLTNYLISTELNINEINSYFSDDTDNCGKKFIFSYGYLPIMTLNYCPVQILLHSTCSRCLYKGVFYYRDSKKTFAVRRTKNRNCIFTLYNSVKHNIISKIEKFPYNNYISLVNTDCDNDAVVRSYIDKANYINENEFTYGHLLRGVK